MVDNNKSLLIINAVLFQLVWFVAVQGNSVYALIGLLLLLGAHFILMKPDINEFILIPIVSVAGILTDSMIMNTGWVQYHGSSEFFVPVWLCVLWVAFATTIKHSMQWVFRSTWLPAILGLFVVPFSYWAGIQLSGSQFLAMPIKVLLLEGLAWSLILTAIGYFLNKPERMVC